MGISLRLLEQLFIGLEKLNMPINEIKMGEFGSQRMVKKTFPKSSEYIKFQNSKEYFESKGIEHTSFDINNKWNSLYMDLSKIQTEWKEYFDIVTDFGTSEHVIGGQYQVFANAHNFVRVGGVMCHCNPVVGRIQMGHPVHDSVYYHEDFYDKLAKLNNYEVVEIKIHKDLNKNKRRGGNLTCILKKNNDKPFCSENDFWNMKSIDDYSKGCSLTKEKFKYENKNEKRDNSKFGEYS